MPSRILGGKNSLSTDELCPISWITHIVYFFNIYCTFMGSRPGDVLSSQLGKTDMAYVIINTEISPVTGGYNPMPHSH